VSGKLIELAISLVSIYLDARVDDHQVIMFLGKFYQCFSINYCTAFDEIWANITFCIRSVVIIESTKITDNKVIAFNNIVDDNRLIVLIWCRSARCFEQAQ